MPVVGPVVVVATLTVKPESVDTARDILTTAVEEVHSEPGCQVYSLHQTGETFVFIEQWADEEALKAHSTAPAVAKMFTAARMTSMAALVSGAIAATERESWLAFSTGFPLSV